MRVSQEDIAASEWANVAKARLGDVPAFESLPVVRGTKCCRPTQEPNTATTRR